MRDIKKDLEDFRKIFYDEIKAIRGYGKVYRNTNEHLAEFLPAYSFFHKKVLSVVASSDQVFSSYYLGASEVDTFDSNIFAYLYFFLKKWNLMKYKRAYISANNEELIRCLEEHNNTDEELYAYEFWRKAFEMINSCLYYSDFFYKEIVDRSLPYDNDLETMAKIISDKSPNYTNLNLFEYIKKDKTYDIIVLSNILEYMYDEEDPLLERVVASNLSKLLNDDGIIISSNILGYDYSSKAIFNEEFIYEDGPSAFYRPFNTKAPLCYTLKKRR